MGKEFNNNGFDYVDLGLPSGTLWATCNVGASKPEDFGLYFQWGGTQGYTNEQVGKINSSIGIIASGILKELSQSTIPMAQYWNWKMMLHTFIWVETGIFQALRNIKSLLIIL